MKHPELMVVIGLIAIAVVMVAVDILIRLVVWPARRDRFVTELLDQLLEPATAPETAPSPTASPALPSALQEPLLRHFETSTTSRQILSTLAGSQGLLQGELWDALNRRTAQKGTPPLPLAAARRVASHLLHAGLLEVDNGVLRLTDLGRTLHALLSGRRAAGRPEVNGALPGVSSGLA